VNRFIVIIILALLLIPEVHGQGILEAQKKTLFSNEQSVGLNLNSNGIGLNYRYARYIDYRNRWHYDIDFNYIKHPKEYKSVIAFDYYTRRFVYGKQNLFWETKAYIGRHHELYRKHDASSISIKIFYSGGISLGFQKPIYYDIYRYDIYGQVIDSEVKKFDLSEHLYNYGGTASFFKGFDELKVIPGLTAKAGFNFEYSEKEPIIHAIEVGIGVTIYPTSIEIMANEETNFFFFKMYLGYRFGNIIDISDVGRAKSRKERRLERQNAMQQMPSRGNLSF
jgi:hypothetical protein